MAGPMTAMVTGCRHDYVGIATGVPQIADDFLHRTKSAESGQNRP
jgi:hypothetical protein